jgi:hypothetical protein
MKPGLAHRLLALAILAGLSALPLSAQEGPSPLLEPTGGLLWQRTEAGNGFSHVMAAEETIISAERSAYSISDKVGIDPTQPLAAYFSAFVVAYKESLLRGRAEEAEFRIDAPASGMAIGLLPYFDLVFPWGSERFNAEYPSMGSTLPSSSIVLRYNLFRLRYALAGLDILAAATALATMDRQTVTVRLYSNRGSFSFDMPLAYFVELYTRLKSRP